VEKKASLEHVAWKEEETKERKYEGVEDTSLFCFSWSFFFLFFPDQDILGYIFG